MQQGKEQTGTVATTTSRLLPGDRAPALRLSRVLNGGRPVEQVTFDQPTAVILWNAACAGCLPAVGEVAAIAADYTMPVFGVAVMVRDVERTAEAALQGSPLAVLALEERPAVAGGLMRGSVTRNWLEASGIPGVPAAYLVDGAGRVAWIGDPAEIADVLPDLVAGSWDVAAARNRWRATASAASIAQLRLARDVMDALSAGQIGAARELVAAGERNLPALAEDPEFAILKFQTLAGAPTQIDEAIAHYRVATTRFADNLRLHTMLGNLAIKQLGGEPEMLRQIIQAMASVSDGAAASVGEEQSRILCRLLEAEAAGRLDRPDDAALALERAVVLATSTTLPDTALAWAARQIDRVRDLLPVVAQDRQSTRE
ncbi:hypothetical protein [Xanthomonas campestris]|uniref:hypothetical protein n=1 Tax=Xanthomonas campestris TaxID=339 RepID=UPI003557A091